MKKTSIRIVAFLLLFAMLLGSIGTITAFAAESTGTLEISFNPNVEGIEVTCDDDSVEDNSVEDLDVSQAHTLKLVIPEDTPYVFKENGKKNHTDVVMPVDGTNHGDWEYQDDTKAWKAIKKYELEKEVKATEGTIKINLKVDNVAIDVYKRQT